MLEIIKQSESFQEFLGRLEENRAMHSCIVESADTVYCDAFMTLAIASIMCENHGCLVCRTCNQVVKKLHIDVVYYPLNGRAMISAADDIEDFNEKVSLKPYEGGNKVFVFNVGKTIRDEWQNKLLKTLEEPPENTYIFLCTDNAERLLPTVRSRCWKINTGKPSEDVIKRLLVDNGYHGRVADVAAQLCEGNITKALALSQNGKYIEMVDCVYDFLANCKSSKDIANFLEKMSGYKEIMNDLTDMFIMVFSRAMKNGRIRCQNAYRLDDLIKIYENYTLKGCVEAIKNISEVKKMSDRNVNQNAILDEMFLRLMEVKYKCRLLSE